MGGILYTTFYFLYTLFWNCGVIMNSYCISCRKGSCVTNVPIFNNLDYDQLLNISQIMESVSYDKGNMIFTEGNNGDTLYFIYEGKIKLYKYTKDGKEQILHILSNGDFFGELNLLKNSAYNFNAKTITDCKVCTLTNEQFKNIIIERPEISIKVLEVIAERLSNMEELIQNLATNDIDSRVAYLLSELCENYGVKDNGNTILIELPISREDMANYIGISRETMSRKLKKFEEEGIINLIGAKKIIVIDKEILDKYI